MNVPNFISVCRVTAVPVFVYLLMYGHEEAAFLTFLAAGLSDALDGFLARALDQRTTLGTFLDPMADKLLAATAFVAVAVTGWMPLWLVIVVISRDVILSLGALLIYILTGALTIKPLLAGKVTTFFQFTTIAASLARPFTSLPVWVFTTLFLITGALTALSGLQYVWTGLRLVGNEG